MPRQRVIVELLPSMLAVSRYRGDALVASRTVHRAQGDWPRDLNAELSLLKADLAKLVCELECKGCPCLVLYHAPGSMSAVTSCAQSAGTSAALEAARLQLSSLASGQTTLSPRDFRLLFRDSAVTDKDLSAQVHILGVADSEDNAATIAAFAESAGLCVEGLVPQDAASVVAAVDALEASEDQHGVTAAVWIGEHGGALAVGNSSRLAFVRTFGIGVHALAEAIRTNSSSARDATGLSPQDAGVGLDYTQSRSLLMEIGIPTPQQALPGHSGLTGASVLPGLQPLIQRLAVEIKQSLRFGVAEEQRAEVNLRLHGPAAAIRNLEASLSRMAGCRVSLGQESGGGVSSQNAMDWVGMDDRLPRIASTVRAGRQRLKRVRRALAVGVGAAAAVLMFNAATARIQLTRERERYFAVQTLSLGSDVSTEVQQVSIDAKLAADALSARVRQRLDGSPPWGATLSALSAAAPPGVKLEELSMKDRSAGTSDAAECLVRGRVTIEAGADPIKAIRSFAKNLESCPLVDGVKLGSTQIADTPDGEAQTFELAIKLVGVPFEARVAAGDGKESDQ